MVLQLHCCLDKLSCNNLLFTVSIPLVNITEYNNAMAAEFMLLKSEKTGNYLINDNEEVINTIAVKFNILFILITNVFIGYLR